MSDEMALFDVSPFYVPDAPSTDPSLSPDQRRTLRQREAIAAGVHPLTKGPLHPFATPKAATPKGPKTAPFTCGSCRFRDVLKHHDRSYPKCLRDLIYGNHDAAKVSLNEVRNVSHGSATDVRAWWPACVGYESGGSTPDAARFTGREAS